MNRFLLVFLSVLWFALPLRSAVEVTPRFQEPVQVGDYLTWDITGLPAEALSDDVARNPTLIIRGPDRREWRRACFTYQEHASAIVAGDDSPGVIANGARILQTRHTVRAAGVHRWTLVDPAGVELARGAVTVAAGSSANSGPIRISPDNPRLLARPDGSVVIPIGPNVAWAQGPDRLAHFTRYFQALHAAGGNHVRVWFASWCGGIESDVPDAYRQDHAWLMDRILALARANQLVVTLVLDNHHDLIYGKHCPYGAKLDQRLATFFAATPGEQYARRLRYVLARWGADDAVMSWELCNEPDLAQPIRERVLPWMNGAADLLKKTDQDRRLISASWCGPDVARLRELPAVQLIGLHRYVLEWADPIGLLKLGTRDGVGMLLYDAGQLNELQRPWSFGEVGYQGTNEENPGNAKDRDGLLLRQQAWAGFLLGGYGSGMNWWWDVYIDEAQLWSSYRGLARATAKLDWRDAELAPLAPNRGHPLRVLGWRSPRHALLWPHLSADTWHRMLVDGDARPTITAPVTMTLSGMAASAHFRLHELDQRSGDELAVDSASADADGNLPVTVGALWLDRVLWIELSP